MRNRGVGLVGLIPCANRRRYCVDTRVSSHGSENFYVIDAVSK